MVKIEIRISHEDFVSIGQGMQKKKMLYKYIASTEEIF